jgi:hypothetical protein
MHGIKGGAFSGVNLLRLDLNARYDVVSNLRAAIGGSVRRPHQARAPCGIPWNVGPSNTVVSASGRPSQKSRAHG